MENYDMRRFLQALKAVQPNDEGALGEECQYSHDEDDIKKICGHPLPGRSEKHPLRRPLCNLLTGRVTVVQTNRSVNHVHGGGRPFVKTTLKTSDAKP